ncbi:hypothetical protein Aph02nite_68770 [Actinoplanes philippinensis]|nr:hypothetical protein Aph02nite_68770 [Actinoplanes philippinensis]
MPTAAAGRRPGTPAPGSAARPARPEETPRSAAPSPAVAAQAGNGSARAATPDTATATHTYNGNDETRSDGLYGASRLPPLAVEPGTTHERLNDPEWNCQHEQGVEMPEQQIGDSQDSDPRDRDVRAGRIVEQSGQARRTIRMTISSVRITRRCDASRQPRPSQPRHDPEMCSLT